MKGASCALTGHRILPASFDRKMLFDELEALIKEGCNSFFCGMAEGFDLLALQFLVDLKENYPIYIEACVPFKGQEKNFSEHNQMLYHYLLRQCDRVTVLLDSYQNGCYLLRNRYMVDCSDLLFAYCTRQSGGTAYTVRYAKSAGRKVIFSKAGASF